MMLMTTPAPARSAGADSTATSPDHARWSTPYLVVDVATVVSQYADLRRALPDALVYYAVKANPLPEVVQSLAGAGACLDVASAPEIEQCLALGIAATRMSFGHTVKKAAAVAAAHAAGIDLFACDSVGELEKIAQHAPGARVTVRLLTHGRGAEWPLSKKFGCDAAMAHDLLLQARTLGLVPWGLSFHVGSQQTDPSQWDEPIGLAAGLFEALGHRGIRLDTVNLGGGFPAHYQAPVPPIGLYGAAIERSLARHFGRRRPQVVVEPGRYLVADAGTIEAEVVLVAEKSYADDTRWVYLDCGKFGGLAETMDEAIKYRIEVPGRSGHLTPVILAGPTCDSADILYERTPCWLPADIETGDRVRILSAGAYTYTYASVGFNGFAPLKAISR